MASWICSICSTSHSERVDVCVGCHYTGGLEGWIDCPKCGLEVPVTDSHCARCYARLHDEDLCDEFDDELDEEDRDEDADEDEDEIGFD